MLPARTTTGHAPLDHAPLHWSGWFVACAEAQITRQIGLDCSALEIAERKAANRAQVGSESRSVRPSPRGEVRSGLGYNGSKGAYPICSALSSRFISRVIATSGSSLSKSTACTACAMGISTRYLAASAITAREVATPSTTNGVRLR